MNSEQALNELRKELAIDGRFADLLRQVAKAMADAELRLCYTTNDPSILIRQTGLAEGIEKLAREISKPPGRVKDTTAGKED